MTGSGTIAFRSTSLATCLLVCLPACLLATIGSCKGGGGRAGGDGGSGRPAASGGAGGTGGSNAGVGGADPGTTVVLFLIDGLMADTARTAAANGATNLKFVMDNGVTVDTVHSTSPAARLLLPDGSLPWGNATSGNVAVHTGTHVFESGPGGMDDIFLATRAAGIKSVFAGGDANYASFTTADFHYAGNLTDEVVVKHAIDHLKADQVRLIRVHLQRLRDDWLGPADKTSPASAYLRRVVAEDALLGQLIGALKDAGVWSQTYLVVSADHGMGQTSASDHPATTATSWDPFMVFYGPDIKRAVTIPYAELPDLAVTTMRFFGLPPLAGHADLAVVLAQRGATGTVLSNLFVGAPDDIPHPRILQRYLDSGTFMGSGDAYGPYRTAILDLIR